MASDTATRKTFSSESGSVTPTTSRGGQRRSKSGCTRSPRTNGVQRKSSLQQRAAESVRKIQSRTRLGGTAEKAPSDEASNAHLGDHHAGPGPLRMHLTHHAM